MAITIGLDFGTHQTKVCIENSDDPNHKTYEFFDWGNHDFVLPSVIQINKDKTISYGKIVIEDAMIGRKKKLLDKPEALILPTEPSMPILEDIEEPILPSMPIYEHITKHGLEFKCPFSDLYGIGRPLPTQNKHEKDIKAWKKRCKKLNKKYKDRLCKWQMHGNSLGIQKPVKPTLPTKPKPTYDADINPAMIATKEQIAEYNLWKKRCEKIRIDYNRAVTQNNNRISLYHKEHNLWIEKCNHLKQSHDVLTRNYIDSLVEYPFIYRYFKQATFSAYNWDYLIEAKDLSVLYLAYIIFKLEERFGNDFAIQMGIPASEKTFNRLKTFASGLLIQAIRLVEDVFENDFDRFIGTAYDVLLELIPPFEYSDDLKYQYGIMVLPEAYASLRSVTANGRIPPGMSLMLDIGGGTTDISFFVIEENGEPHVYHFESIPKGLNYFLEYGQNSITDFSVKRELENLPSDTFSNAYKDYKGMIDHIVKNLTIFLHKDTISRGFNKHSFIDAIRNRPVIYTGGGCYDCRMRKPVLYFTDIIHLNKSILRIPNVFREHLVNIPYSIMATSFGLSISLITDDIQVSPKEELFEQYAKEDNDRWNAHREHGMYED